MNYTNNKEYSTPRSIFSSMLNECTAAYTKIDGNRLIVKNRDKNYEPEITVFHEIFDGTEILYYVDERARHAEGINEHGVGILYTTTSFKRDDADRKTANIQIIKSALTKKDPIEIMRILAHQDGGVKGIMIVSTPDATYQIENKADSGKGKKAKKLGSGKAWSVITNLPTMLQGATSEKDGENYISSKIRQAVAQAALYGCKNVTDAMDSLAFKYFADESHHNMLRDSDFEQTVMQVGMDLNNRDLYLTSVPGKVKKLTQKSSIPDDYEPVCKFIEREYFEPTLAPFRLFTTNIDESVEKFSLVNYLLGDGPEKDIDSLEDRHKSTVQKTSKMKLAQKAADELWEKEKLLVSLVRKLKKDPIFFTAGHTSSQVNSELEALQKMIEKIGDDYHHLLNIIHIERYGEPMHDLIEEASKNKRIPRKKGQKKGSSKHSDLYTDENPKGTIKGLKFATVKDAETSVNKIKRSGRTHAHKVQAAVAMEQRAKAAGKKTAAGVYRSYINSVKKESLQSNKKRLLEISKLPKEYFTKIDSAIKNSNFWTKDNDVESIDAGPKGSLQSPAAYALETALQQVFDELGLDVDAFVSTFDTDDENMQLNPGHPAYPNRWLIDARWYVSKQRPGRNTIDLQIMPYGDDADPVDVNSAALVRHIAQTVRHELVHRGQMKKQSIKKGLNDDMKAFDEMMADPAQVPQDKDPVNYLKSHIEIDAHAHDAAEELLALHGLQGSKRLLSQKIDASDPTLPNALQHYLMYLPEDSSTVKELKKKIIKYLEYFVE
ncbi:MAG: hypothetical protein CMK38_00040 [Porticoccaceae bacterium]|nr:hypothetical protein [Porticoccaceae bacterium]